MIAGLFKLVIIATEKTIKFFTPKTKKRSIESKLKSLEEKYIMTLNRLEQIQKFLEVTESSCEENCRGDLKSESELETSPLKATNYFQKVYPFSENTSEIECMQLVVSKNGKKKKKKRKNKDRKSFSTN